MSQSLQTLHQCLAISIVALDEFAIGLGNGWLAPTLDNLSSPNCTGEICITPDQSSWIASLDSAGKILGAIMAAVLLDIIGRRILLTCCAFVFFFIWLITWLTPSASILYFVRFLFGVFVGVNDGTNSTYLAENSSPLIRNVFGCICCALYYVGVLTEFVIATYLPFGTASGVNFAVTFLAFTSVLWIKEPVQYLLMKGRPIQAERNFIWLHARNPDTSRLENEFEKIRQNVMEENLRKTSFKRTLSSVANYRSLFIMVSIYCLAGCTGYLPIMAYASATFTSTDTLSSNEFTVLLGITQTLIAAPASLFVGRFNRRPVIMISYFIVATTHVLVSILFYIHRQFSPIPRFPWLAFASVTFFTTVNAFVYPAVFLIRGELFPLSIKATGSCLSIIGFSATSFFFTKIFLFVVRNYGIEANFILYALLTFALVIFVYFFLPETRNKSLIEIQSALEGNT